MDQLLLKVALLRDDDSLASHSMDIPLFGGGSTEDVQVVLFSPLVSSLSLIFTFYSQLRCRE